MSQGIHVFGSASMGALRAAQLWPFGMEGVGVIFESYRDGKLEDDDEVAMTHGPSEVGFVAASEAMVDIRPTVRGGAGRHHPIRSRHSSGTNREAAVLSESKLSPRPELCIGEWVAGGDSGTPGTVAARKKGKAEARGRPNDASHDTDPAG